MTRNNDIDQKQSNALLDEAAAYAGGELDITKLHDDVAKMPAYYGIVGEQIAANMDLIEGCKIVLDKAVSDAYSDIRKDLESKGEKVTEARLSKEVEADKNCFRVKQEIAELQTTLTKWRAVQGTLNTRCNSHKVLAQLYAAQYWTLD